MKDKNMGIKWPSIPQKYKGIPFEIQNMKLWIECVEACQLAVKESEVSLKGIKDVLDRFQSSDLATHTGTIEIAKAIFAYLKESA